MLSRTLNPYWKWRCPRSVGQYGGVWLGDQAHQS
jgi:hypothetical protein